VNRTRLDPDVKDALERQADALESIDERLRVQNAALVELTRSVDKLVGAQTTGHPGDSNNTKRIAANVEDAALDLSEQVDLDAVDRVSGDGDSL
jgi:hypothetical protein